ncbi:B3 domain-containing protein Os12g0592300 [Brachypodium distachyon]|uniref:TF-B3 domain-containing protein n=1 Tax=Brachypodium distachyon TaxID=15368 RepID=A0A0Q3EEB5_BRADI|nr:B3 domain-containing protein Os12g0592300 [Brachypodium distachyon]KQJ86030.1 hypothetical protein BRADI_4g02950v3 [Brachypodium distachyon]PNT62415.1 hypothetical protein BRADI_4g02950v3 [Brachypodium distachyon]|eukprot:XP_010237091.1 B3 domain-containing protein Os12g0592300 [Brachypodium distachyon]
MAAAGKMMGEKGGCGRCREWQEHYYWEHMDVSKIRFSKIMAGDFQQSISIPEKFANNFSGQIDKGCTLKVPSGETWRVGIEKIADKLFFVSGWDAFAKAHELQEHDILFFKCSGSGSFDVLIFDASGCEKVSSFFTDKKGTNMHKHFDHIVSQQAEEHYLLSDSGDVNMPPSPLVGSPHKASASNKPSGKTKPREESESPNDSDYRVKHELTQEENDSDDEDTDSNKYYSRFANYLTLGEREEIFGLASIQPGNPIFVAVLQKSHVRHRNNFLIISSKFAADHLEGRSQDMLLLRPNRKEKWYVKYYYHASSTRGFNCQRWVKFVRDNKLREGYICIFELLKGTRKATTATMMIHVIRKVDDRFVLLG